VRKLRQGDEQVATGSPEDSDPTIRSPGPVTHKRPAATKLAESTALSHATPLDPARRAYTINETAWLLSVSRNTIYKLIKNKSLKKIKACRTLITHDSIEELLAGKEK
jgi:excisionase family DNA binding protein